ncbi:MAG: hypothetical protein Q4F57_01370 [Weeksellaceae bacterium]|nr:hypothetical protein [Weeksellaceae bacterium]
MKKAIAAIALLLGIGFGHCQEDRVEYEAFTAYSLFSLGYAYQGSHFIEPGYNLYLVRPNNHIIDLGATLNVGYANDRMLWIPEAQLGYLFNFKNKVVDPYSANFNSAFWLARASISPYHVTPEVGITVLSLLELTVGYGYVFNEHPAVDLSGLKLGLGLRIPFLLFWNDND